MNEMATTLAEATAALARVSDTPRLDAELLMADALGLERGAMLLMMRDLAVPDEFARFVERRLRHEPVAYVIGYRDFWDIRLTVTPDVLIPRADSETLIEAAIKHFDDVKLLALPDRKGLTVLDLGTGSGALLLAALSAFQDATGTGIDASEAALIVAAANADQTGFAIRTRFLHRSWCEHGWTAELGQYDLILCNPPYVETDAELAPQVRDHEPASALFAGQDGLDDYKILIPQIPGLLKPDGVAIFEIGKGQDGSVADLAEEAGFHVAFHHDLGGIIRALSLTKKRDE